MSSNTPASPTSTDKPFKSSALPEPEIATASRVGSEALFRGASVLEIEHNGQIYRLQKTALNKLILTK